MLTEQMKQRLLQHYQDLNLAGKFLPQQQRDQYYARFRSRFGPDQLSKLDGERLLEAMHGGKGSMMYWLEFKNDDEFSTNSFGGIGGGSALKFGVFRRKETGNWAVAGKGNIPEEITVAQAVEIARKTTGSTAEEASTCSAHSLAMLVMMNTAHFRKTLNG